jgi:hypothetical protein
MDRRTFIGAFAGSLLAAWGIADAQPAAKLPILGVLVTDIPGNLSLPILVQGLRDLGYIDGKNIVIAVRSAGGTPDAFPCSCGRTCSTQGRCDFRLRSRCHKGRNGCDCGDPD